jgi:peroxiredoxin Q/BCP
MKSISNSVSLAAAFAVVTLPVIVVGGFSLPNPHSPQDSLMERNTFFKKMATAVAIPSLTSLVVSSSPQKASASSSKDIPKLGAKAPSFSLPNSRELGTNISLDQLTSSGKWTVLYFYPGAFTSGCTLEARGFQKDINDYRNLNTQIVGVSVDSIEKNAQFCAEEKLDFILLTDEGGKVSKAYGTALSIPGFGTFSNRQTYLIDPNGDVQYVFTDVESHVARHSAEVLDKLKELQS